MHEERKRPHVKHLLIFLTASKMFSIKRNTLYAWKEFYSSARADDAFKYVQKLWNKESVVKGLFHPKYKYIFSKILLIKWLLFAFCFQF